MLDYKTIIIKRYALGMSDREIARQIGASKSGVNEFLKSFEECDAISYPLPSGITNYGIAELVYGKQPGNNGRNPNFEYPDYADVNRQLSTRKNMALVFLWNRYKKKCEDMGRRYYQYRQFCEHYSEWCDENAETLHFNAVIGKKMEVDFAGKTFGITDPLTGDIYTVVVFVAVLPYSQYIYAEGMLSAKEPQWIDVNNHALDYFGGVPALVICNNCKQAVIANEEEMSMKLFSVVEADEMPRTKERLFTHVGNEEVAKPEKVREEDKPRQKERLFTHVSEAERHVEKLHDVPNQENLVAPLHVSNVRTDSGKPEASEKSSKSPDPTTAVTETMSEDWKNFDVELVEVVHVPHERRGYMIRTAGKRFMDIRSMSMIKERLET